MGTEWVMPGVTEDYSEYGMGHAWCYRGLQWVQNGHAWCNLGLQWVQNGSCLV